MFVKPAEEEGQLLLRETLYLDLVFQGVAELRGRDLACTLVIEQPEGVDGVEVGAFADKALPERFEIHFVLGNGQ